MVFDALLILVGALLGGFVNGLSGFGTTLVALPFWVHAVPPVVAAQLGAAGGIVGNLQTVRIIWPTIRWPAVAPYIAAGLVGVPIGTTLLPLLEPRAFKLGVGAVLIAFCLFQLIGRNRLHFKRGGAAADAVVGFLGGFLGGLAGMSGPLPTMWASLRDLSKEDKRMLFQSFNLSILSAVLCVSAIQGLLSWHLAKSLLIALPGSMVGARLGHAVYFKLPATHYDRVVLILLLLSGINLLWSNL